MSPAPTPFPVDHRPEAGPAEPMDNRTRLVAARFRGVMEALGLELDDPNLAETPARVARAYRSLFSGLEAGAEPELRTFANDEGYSGIVSVTGIRFQSLCAHHFLPFFGVAHVAYLPKERLVGLSKLARVVDLFARRPQVQERLTEQVASFLDSRLQPAGVMIMVKARHFCMEMRGVRKAGARTTTSAVRGAFADVRLQRELLARIRG
jgi:GTP cyclohydrolase I